MITLGLSCFYHDSAACLIVDGKIVAAAAEERFSRKKHDNKFPKEAIEFCLKQAQIACNEVDLVVFYEKPIIKFERILYQHLNHFPKSYKAFIKNTSSWFDQKLKIKNLLQDELNFFGQINFIPHHLSHAASSYYLSPFKKSVIVTIDGVGEWATTTIGFGEKNKVKLDQQINFPHSLGLLYSTITAYLGFRVNNSEYKVMGLAAYGNPEKFYRQFNKLINLHDDGSYSLNMKYFDYDWADHMPSTKMSWLFLHRARKQNAKIKQHHRDIAAALQAKLEEAVLNLLNTTYRKYKKRLGKTPNLCLAGGVALNSVMNGKILSQTPFKKLYIPPDPGDGGGAMGAALFAYYQKNKSESHTLKAKRFTPYLGPGYSWHQIKTTLDKYKARSNSGTGSKKIKYKFYSDRSELLDIVSDLIIKEKVIGWFQGRMEWGPRALGNRSILAAANKEKMRDLINAKIKKREMFRPFAPIVLEEYVRDYFEADQPLSEATKYMLMVYPFKDRGKREVPAVVHVNGSGRLQSLARKDNPLYYDLIDEYYKKTSTPIIINTSFNIRGEPIVCTPEEAVQCFLKTEIDYLVIDQFLVQKHEK